MKPQRILQTSIVMVLLGCSLSAGASNVSISIGSQGFHFSVSHNDRYLITPPVCHTPRHEMRHRGLAFHYYKKVPAVPRCKVIIKRTPKPRRMICRVNNTNVFRNRILPPHPPYRHKSFRGTCPERLLPTHRQFSRRHDF